MQSPTSTETKALALLSSGITSAECARALGVTDSYISQLIGDEEFTRKLAEQRFEALRKNNARDNELDELEDTLIAKIKESSRWLVDPMKAAKLFQIVNAAKRRGSSAPASLLEKQTVIRLNMPITLVQKFTLNGQNQIITAGSQDLVTIQSHRMETLAATGLESARNGIHKSLTQALENVRSTPANSELIEAVSENEFGI